MTEQHQNNKLIAEFMGGVYKDMGDEYSGNFKHRVYSTKIPNLNQPAKYYRVFEFRYHESWDWLMPVVEKIFLIIKKLKSEHLYVGDAAVNISCLGVGSHIEDVYDAALKFIIWHNSITTVSAGKKIKETDGE